MITLFKSDETDFTHNGLGNLDAYIQNPVVEEEINGLYSFTFKYPLFAPRGLEIEGESIIRVPVPEKEDQLFRVYRHVKSMGYITVSCYHIFYDLADNFIEDTNIVEKDGQGAIQQLGSATQFGHRFRFYSDIQTVANARLVRKNVVASILDDEQGNSFVSRWGGELIRNNFDVRMNQNAGSNRGFEVKYRKNLTGYEADVDDSTVYTRIMPKGFDGLLLPEKYIDSPLIGNYESPKIKMIDYDVKAAVGEYADDEDAIPLEDAYAELRRLAAEEYSINKIDIPTVSYKVDFVMLEQTEEYKDLADLQKLKMGDMVTVDHELDDFKVSAKLVRYKYDPIAERYLLAELGSMQEGVTSTFADIKKINREVTELKEQTLIIQSTADGKNTIYRGEFEPINPNVDDLWYKPNGSETEMYQYVNENGQKYWKLIADTGDVTKVQKDVDTALEDVQQAKNRADEAVGKANLATSNANEAISEAQTAFDKAQDALSQSDDALSQSLTAFDKSTEAFTKAEEGFTLAQENATEIQGLATRILDAEGNYTSISGTVQGLQTQVGNIQGDVTAVTQLATGLQTRVNNAEGDITSLTQTAQGLQTQVNDNKGNITSVTQLAQGLQTRVGDAEGNISTLTQTATNLGTRIGEIEDWEIGGRNLALNSKDGWTSNVYKVFEGILSMEWEVGETYTVTIKGTVNSGQSFGVWRDTGSISFSSRLTPNEDRTIWTFTGKVNGTTQSKKDVFSVYNTPNATANSAKVEWIKIEKGNKATDYTEAPEDTDQKFSAINQEIGSIATRVQTNANNYSSLTQTVQGVQTTVATKADKSTVTQLSNLLNTTITNKADKSEVMQLADVVSTKVSSSQVNSLIAQDKGIKDTRDTNEKPSYYFTNYKKITVREFKRLTIVGVTSDGGYGVLETEVPWSDTSGGQIKQTLYTDLATYERRGVNSSDTWQAWKKVADVDYVEGRISVLNNAINLRVQKNDVINQINIDTSGVLLQGRKILLDGDTTVLGTFRVKDANIVNVNADKMTTGTLNAANVNIINMNASNITSGTINTANITIRGGSNIDYTLIDGSFFESRGRFTRTWRGTTKTHDIKLRFENGYLRARNDNDNRSLYFTELGVSTFADGSGDGSGSRSSGTIEFFSRRFNSTYNGLTLYSSAVVGVDADKFKVDSEQDIEFETQSAFRIRPQINSPGNNTFRFTLSPDTVAANVDGYLLYGSESDNQASGFRFSKRKSDPRIQVVGDQFQTGGNTTIEAGIGEFNEVKRRANNGNISIAHANLLTVGDDSQGGRLASIATYNRQYSASANMHITNQGTLGRITSARKYKTDIEPIGIEAAMRFYNQAQPVYYRPFNTADDNMQHSYYGYIADDVALIEPRLVQFGQDGAPEGFNYDRVPTLLHAAMKYEVDRLDGKIDLTREELVFKIARLEQRIMELESAA